MGAPEGPDITRLLSPHLGAGQKRTLGFARHPLRHRYLHIRPIGNEADLHRRATLRTLRFSGHILRGLGLARDRSFVPTEAGLLQVGVEMDLADGEIYGPDRPNLAGVDPGVCFRRGGERHVLT